jgi:hypothetical protein
MKSSQLLLLCTTLAGTVSPLMAQSSSTPVIGFYKFTIPTGTSLWTCGLVTKKDFQGAMTGTATVGTKSTITVDSATWAANSLPLHYVEILSGPQTGLILDIDPATPNTATQLTVLGKTTGAGSFALTGTETFCIRAHATLAKVFLNGAGLNAGTDSVTLIGSAGRASYRWTGTWENADGDDASNTIVYPGQAFLITNGKGAVSTLTFGGGEVAYVKSGPTKIPLYRGIPNLVGIINPLVSTDPADSFFASSQNILGDFGLVSALNPGSDNVSIRQNNGNLTATGSYLVNGTMIDADDNDATNVAVRNGIGIIINVSQDRTWTAPALQPGG